MDGILVDLEAYRRRVQSPQVKIEVKVCTEERSAHVEHTLCRREAQEAVGRVPLRDVLLSLRRSGLIVAFRLNDDVLVVKVERTLPFLFGTCDLQ
jgi:hypothetical protein